MNNFKTLYSTTGSQRWISKSRGGSTMTILYTTYKDFPKEQQQWIKDIDERLERERIQREIDSRKAQLNLIKNPKMLEYNIKRIQELEETA